MENEKKLTMQKLRQFRLFCISLNILKEFCRKDGGTDVASRPPNAVTTILIRSYAVPSIFLDTFATALTSGRGDSHFQLPPGLLSRADFGNVAIFTQLILVHVGL